MNGIAFRWGVLLLTPVLIAVAAIWLRPSAASSAEPPMRQKWEYCQLWSSRNDKTENEQVWLRRGAEELNATSMTDLGQKMKLQIDKSFSTLTVLDALGGEGWELVAVSERVLETRAGREVAIRWTFKRLK